MLPPLAGGLELWLLLLHAAKPKVPTLIAASTLADLIVSNEAHPLGSAERLTLDARICTQSNS